MTPLFVVLFAITIAIIIVIGALIRYSPQYNCNHRMSKISEVSRTVTTCNEWGVKSNRNYNRILLCCEKCGKIKIKEI